MFIIIAQNSQLLLQTIRSRCVTVRFSPVSDEKMESYITSLGAGEDKKDFLVKYSHGIPYEAKKILQDESFEQIRYEALKKLNSLFSKRKLAAYAVCDFLEENKDNAQLIISLWREMVRDIILIQNGAKELITNSDYKNEIGEFAQKIDEKKAALAEEELLRTEEMLRRYVNLHAAALHLALCTNS